ncbi:undecaprenyl-diphosphate phosphatase [Isobaculum melis]|uniref:Undecaprenyl-diphosphatase n=1 Tax=Isobaculum melis TaxID=142588 RepID=A0A1H9UI51_9LACT|nr:undecaprenyl-diphosphate phosphatase [Isobaculum melis]SES08958.1 Undecaprenyl-diphosphatase [Isobaculum melis]
MVFFEILKAVLLGIVEGVTEWLPISSTGHMILFDEFIKLDASDAFKSMFFVVIQLGAIMAVVVLYFNKLNPFGEFWQLIKNFYNKVFRKKKVVPATIETISLWMKVLVATIPAAIIGLKFDDDIDRVFYNYLTVAITLIIYGVLFIILENRNKNRQAKITTFAQLSYKTAALIGVFQVLALIPGTSRSGATILGAILLGTSRFIAAEFSFFLAIPVMFGASALKLFKFGLSFTGMEVAILLTGTIVSFIVSIIAIKFLMTYIKKNDFKAFGYYRIILGVIVLGYFLLFSQ